MIEVSLVAAAIGIIFMFASQGSKRNSSSKATIKNSLTRILPENDNILANTGEIAVTYKKDPNVKVTLEIEETAISVRGVQLITNQTVIIIAIIFLSISIFGLEQLRRMVKSAERGHPFTRANIRRIYTLSAIFFSFPFLIAIGNYFLTKWIMSNFEFSGVTIQNTSSMHISWFIVAAFLLTIGKIVEKGIEMKEEQALTI